jgi:hypothetical protein
VRSARTPKFLLGAAALLVAIGVFLAVRSRYAGGEPRRSRYYFQSLASVAFSSPGRHVSIFRPEGNGSLVLSDSADGEQGRSCITHSLNPMTLDVAAPLPEDQAKSLERRGVKGALSIVGSGGALYWEALVVAGTAPGLFLLERGRVLPLRSDTPLADALARGCAAMR